MTQAIGSRAYLAIQKEAAFATDPQTPALVRLPFTSESLSRSIELIDSDTIRGVRSAVPPVRGNTDVAGSVNFNLNAYPGEVLLGALGAVTTSGETAPYTHVIKVGDTVPSFTIEKGFSDISQFFKYQGCKVNRFSLTASPTGFQKASIDLIGAKLTTAGTSFDETLTDYGLAEFDGFRISSITEGGSAITSNKPTEVSFTIENNLDGDTFYIGGNGQRAAVNEGLVKVSGTIRGLFESLALYNKAVAQTETALVLTYQFGTGAGTAGNEYLSFDFPEVVLSVNDPPIEGPKGIYYSIGFTAYYGNDAKASSAVITLKNTQASL